MRKDIASMLLASTIISTKINSSQQGKILQSMAQASLPHKPSQTFASFAVSRKTNFASAAIRPKSIRALTIDVTYGKRGSTFVDIWVKKEQHTHKYIPLNKRF